MLCLEDLVFKQVLDDRFLTSVNRVGCGLDPELELRFLEADSLTGAPVIEPISGDLESAKTVVSPGPLLGLLVLGLDLCSICLSDALLELRLHQLCAEFRFYHLSDQLLFADVIVNEEIFETDVQVLWSTLLAEVLPLRGLSDPIVLLERCLYVLWLDLAVDDILGVADLLTIWLQEVSIAPLLRSGL